MLDKNIVCLIVFHALLFSDYRIPNVFWPPAQKRTAKRLLTSLFSLSKVNFSLTSIFTSEAAHTRAQV